MKIGILHYSGPEIIGGVEAVIAKHAQLFEAERHQVAVIAGRGVGAIAAGRSREIALLDSRHEKVLLVKAELDRGLVGEAFFSLKDQIVEQLSEALLGLDLVIAHNICSLHKNLALTVALKEIWDANPAWRLWLWHHDLAWTAANYSAELHPGFPWDLLKTPWAGVRQIVVSELRKQELQTLFRISPDQVAVVGNGVDLESFLKFEKFSRELVKGLSLESACPLILLPVRITRRKNIELAIRVVAELQQYFKQATLVITGPPGAHNPANSQYLEELRQLRDQLGMGERVVFLADHCNQPLAAEVISDFFALADLLLLPSFEEGFGIPLLEAALRHIPIFCSEIDVLREVGQGLVDYFDPRADVAKVARQIFDKLSSDCSFRYAALVKGNCLWGQIYNKKIRPLLEYVTEEDQS